VRARALSQSIHLSISLSAFFIAKEAKKLKKRLRDPLCCSLTFSLLS
jgi:hypothetical protein